MDRDLFYPSSYYQLSYQPISSVPIPNIAGMVASPLFWNTHKIQHQKNSKLLLPEIPLPPPVTNATVGMVGLFKNSRVGN